ncbi:MAG TPA: acetate--CoA ligase family protein [Candidatus Udaeobacter sp.]|nr:acetate--CoA ligase family protein [Candidatus Udaeobacter sp.]
MTPIDCEPLWPDLTPLMQPMTVAVVGASQRLSQGAVQREARGNRIIRNLMNAGFEGRIFPVNPKYSEVLGFTCYPELASIPEPVDCVVAAIPGRRVPELLESGARAGVRAAVVFSSGFAEIGPEGQKRQAKLEALAKEHNLLICGPNCYGVLNVFGRAPLFSSVIPPGFLSGPVALVSQSGGLSTTIANALMHNRGVGLSYIVSCGNQAGVTVEEYINHFVEDERTRVIAAFVEGFKQPAKLLAVARKALAKKKPLIILKGGNSEVSRRAAATHSGSLAGAAEIVEAAFQQSGIVQVRSLNELIDTISLFSCDGFIERYRGGRRIGAVSGSGGECTLVADAIDNARLESPDLSDTTKSNLRQVLPDFGNPHNPLDGTGAMYDDETIFPRLLDALIRDPNTDLVTVNIEANDPRPKELKSGNRFASATAKAAANSQKAIAIFSSVIGGAVDPEIVRPLRASGVPFMEGAEFTMAALRHLADYHDFVCRSRDTDDRHLVNVEHPQLPSGILSSEAAFRLLASFGIPVIPTVLAGNADEAVEAATRIGFPVALKVESPDISHKSEVGGVALHLTTVAAVRQAYLRIHEKVNAHVPAAQIAGVVVQRMAPEGVEIILGIKRDPIFGPVIVCGFGGIFVELLKDVAIGIPPFSQEQARELIKRLRGWPLLTGVRGKPPADIDALCNAVAGLSQLAVSLRDQIETLDINPLVVHADARGAVAVDALVQIR